MSVGAPMKRLWPRTLLGKAGAAVVLALLLLAVVWCIALAVTSWRLSRAMKVSETEFGLTNDLDVLLGAPVPPEKNIATPLDEAAELLRGWLTAATKRTGNIGVLHQFDHDAVLQGQVMGPELDALLAEADRRTEYHSPFLGLQWKGIADPFYKRRDVMFAEMFVARRLEEQGRTADAARRLVRLLRLCRKWTAREPFRYGVADNLVRRIRIIEQVNGLLRDSKFSPAIHEEIDAELTEQGKCRDGLAFQYQVLKLRHLEDFAAHPGRQSIWWKLRPVADNDRTFIVEWHNRLMRGSRRSYSEIREELELAGQRLELLRNDPWESKLHPETRLDWGKMTHSEYDALLIHARCLQIVNAMAKRGDWSSPLDVLGLPSEVLCDPCTDRPLRVKSTPNGPVVYSLGFNRTDDGGDLWSGRDRGLGPKEPEVKFP